MTLKQRRIQFKPRHIPSLVKTVSNFDKLFSNCHFLKTKLIVVHDFATRKHTKDLTTVACITRPTPWVRGETIKEEGIEENVFTSGKIPARSLWQRSRQFENVSLDTSLRWCHVNSNISYTCVFFSIHEYCCVWPNKILPLTINYNQFFTLYARRPE